jgi:trehalose 6-phosphate phosphatase
LFRALANEGRVIYFRPHRFIPSDVIPLAETEIPTIALDGTALLLDIDGTLLDIASTPDGVAVPPDLKASICVLYERLGRALAFVSGRTLESIDALFSPPTLPAIGCHGAQLRPSADHIETVDIVPAHFGALFSDIATLAAGILVEDKQFSVAIHYRLAPEAEEQIVRRLLEHRDAIAAAGLQLLRGKAMVEIKSRAYNKGSALKALMSYPPFSGRRPVFLGDDTTDEDVFRVLPDFGGIGLSVGRRIQGAKGTFDSPADVRRWLAKLVLQD